jgi:hypothetical protein
MGLWSTSAIGHGMAPAMQTAAASGRTLRPKIGLLCGPWPCICYVKTTHTDLVYGRTDFYVVSMHTTC